MIRVNIRVANYAILILLVVFSGCSPVDEKDYYENGKLKSIVGLVDGEREGIMLFYDEGGNVIKELPWKKGKKDGKERVYYESGQLKQERIWQDGLLNGLEKTYEEDGTLYSVAVLDSGKTTEVTIYKKDGKMVEHQLFDKEGRIVYAVSYDENGQKRLPLLPPIFESVKDTIQLGETYHVSLRLGVEVKGTLQVFTGHLDSNGELKDRIELKPGAHNTFKYSITPSRSGQITVPFIFRLDPSESDTIRIDGMLTKHTFYVNAGSVS